MYTVQVELLFAEAVGCLLERSMPAVRRGSPDALGYGDACAPATHRDLRTARAGAETLVLKNRPPKGRPSMQHSSAVLAAASGAWTAPEIATVAAAVIAAVAAIIGALYSAQAARSLDVRRSQRELRRPAYEQFDDALRGVCLKAIDLLQEAPYDGLSTAQDGRGPDEQSRSRDRAECERLAQTLYEASVPIERYGSRRARKVSEMLVRRATELSYKRPVGITRAHLRRLNQQLQGGREDFRRIVRKDLDLR